MSLMAIYKDRNELAVRDTMGQDDIEMKSRSRKGSHENGSVGDL